MKNKKINETRRETDNYVSEWFGRRIFPEVKIRNINDLVGHNKNVCPFLTEILSRKTECWKSVNSKGVCTISSASNKEGLPPKKVRQDWLVCPHRVIHTNLVKESCSKIFGDDAIDSYPVPVSALRDPNTLAKFRSDVQMTGRGFLFFQDKLGGEISLSGTEKNPEMSFDVTLVEIIHSSSAIFSIGRYGIMEVQTMDFHGSYKGAVDALNNALDLHGAAFPETLQSNLDWARRGVEGPNIANVFKRTFYQMLVKFQLASGGAAAGTVLALPKAVWDSWQPFLGGPALEQTKFGHSVIAGSPPSALNAYICVFDIDAKAEPASADEAGASGAVDISPVRIVTFVKVTPETLAHHAFNEVPREILRNIAGTDLILSSIRARLARWWPDLNGPDLFSV